MRKPCMHACMHKEYSLPWHACISATWLCLEITTYKRIYVLIYTYSFHIAKKVQNMI